MTDPGQHDPYSQTSARPSRRRGPDLLTLVAGLGALGVAAAALLGGFAWLPGLDVRWVLATVAMIVGLLLVLGSIRPRRS